MRKIEKKKKNPFLIFTVLLLVGIIAGFIFKTSFYTPKETIISLDENTPKTTIRTQNDVTEFKPNNVEEKNLNYSRDVDNKNTSHVP